jgi:hypothetical protein
MRRFAVVLLAVACGGKSQPRPVIGHHVEGPLAPTCADVGVILRGPVERNDNSAEAGHAREAAIANACEIDAWPAPVIACIASKPKPSKCLDELTEQQRGAYNEKLQAWAEQYGGDAYGGEDYGGADVPDEPEVACTDAIAKPGVYGPPFTASGDDQAWDQAMRKHALGALCEVDNWEQDARRCLQSAVDAPAATDCFAFLPAESRDHVSAKLAEVDGVAGKLAAARKQPKQLTCDKIVAGYYADARWKAKVDWVKGKDRTKMIAESRDRMKKACTADKWSDTLRACVSVGGGDGCFVAGGGDARAWGFPASGVVISTGVPACDEWGKEVTKLASCDKLPQTSRDALRQAYDQLQQSWATMPIDQRAGLAEACKAATDAVHQLGSMCP